MGNLRRTITAAASIYLAGMTSGAVLLYFCGPSLGAQLRYTGGRLAGLDGDQPLQTAQEARDLVEALADEAVTRRVTALIGARAVAR